jgi:hypothetical protein
MAVGVDLLRSGVAFVILYGFERSPVSILECNSPKKLRQAGEYTLEC